MVSFGFFTQDLSYNIHKSIIISESSLLVFRLFNIFFFLAIIIWMLAMMEASYFIFMTNWGFLTGFLYFLFISIEKLMIKQRNDSFWKITHVIFEISLNVEFTIFFFYWTALFNLDLADNINKPDFGLWLFNDICIHFLAFFFLWIDNFFNHIAIIKSHLIIVVAFEIIYGIFNCIYTLKIGNIYPPITWDTYLSYIFIIVLILITVAHYYLAFYFYHKIKKPIIAKKNDKDSTEVLYNNPYY